jgi:hypothetical protein
MGVTSIHATVTQGRIPRDHCLDGTRHVGLIEEMSACHIFQFCFMEFRVVYFVHIDDFQANHPGGLLAGRWRSPGEYGGKNVNAKGLRPLAKALGR